MFFFICIFILDMIVVFRFLLIEFFLLLIFLFIDDFISIFRLGSCFGLGLRVGLIRVGLFIEEFEFFFVVIGWGGGGFEVIGLM